MEKELEREAKAGQTETATKVISSMVEEPAKESSKLPEEISTTVNGKTISAMAKQKSPMRMELSMKASM